MGICSQCGKRKDILYFDRPTERWDICYDCCSPVFVRGEEVEVSDNLPQEEGFCPEKAKYVCTINHEFPYVVETIGNPAPVAYKHIRKLPKQEAGPKKFFIKKDIELFTTYNHMEGSEGQAIYLFLKTHGMLEE